MSDILAKKKQVAVFSTIQFVHGVDKYAFILMLSKWMLKCLGQFCYGSVTNNTQVQNPDCYSRVCHSSDPSREHVSHLLSSSARPPPNRAEERHPSRALRSTRTVARRHQAPRMIPTLSEVRGGFRTVSVLSLTQTYMRPTYMSFILLSELLT